MSDKTLNKLKDQVKGKQKVRAFKKKKKEFNTESTYVQSLQEKYDNIETDSIQTFLDLPLSSKTLKGLKECGYTKPTEIQKETIKLSLTNKDILGAAQTGSGKTLAFIIPILEHLYCKQWTKLDGIGALVITPTRELAYQIFEELRRVGEHHDFSAGLIIGGKDLKFERNRMDQCNIVICTPGRLLQHMDENPLFDCVNMEILVLDEADRCLDLGFEQTMNAILANLPPTRQTMLFSATQTKSVKDLARLSLNNPSYVSVHEHEEYSTPKGLHQSYVVCELENKISILWSFIKNHLKQKIIIFLASCKEVKYVYEVFCRMRPGVSLMPLYGTLHQLRRMDIYESFCKKSSAVLFATDIAARGLDFPEVHWVVQGDCPEDAATYIHRVGRTARYHRGGESLLLLLPSELHMLENLKERKIPIQKIDINPLKLNNPVRKMEAFLARDPALKDTAQRAFVSYAKSVFLMKDKNVFDVLSLDTDSFAKSLGLAIPPRIRFLQRLNARTGKKVQNTKNKMYLKDDDGESQEKESEKDIGLSDDEKSYEKSYAPFHVSDDSDSDDGVLKVKRKDHDIDLPKDLDLEESTKRTKRPVTKAAMAKRLLKKKIIPNKKIVFSEDGEAVSLSHQDKKSELAQQYEQENAGGIDIEKAKLVLKEEDKFDKQLFKDKVKAKHKEEKRKLKDKRKQQGDNDQDEFGMSESEEEPDLSWLPDPDRIYGKKDDEAFSQESDSNIEPLRTKKRKMDVMKANSENNKKKKKKEILKELGENLNINEAEELALMLLKNT